MSVIVDVRDADARVLDGGSLPANGRLEDR